MELCREQMKDGHYFLHEHPASASSWDVDVVLRVAAIPGVVKTTVDQCQYGMRDTPGNSSCMAESLSSRCNGRSGNFSRQGGGSHAECSGKRARLAAIYHFKLCKAILVGFREQMKADGKCREGIVGMIAVEEDWASM